MRLAVLSQARDEEERVKPVKGERRFRGVKTGRMKARMTHKDRREQGFRGAKTWADKNERNCLQESLQTALLRC